MTTQDFVDNRLVVNAGLKWTFLHFAFVCLLFMLCNVSQEYAFPPRLKESSTSHSVVSNSLQPHELQHARLPYPSLSPGVCSNSCPLSQWCHPTISYLLPPSLALSLPQHQGLFQWVSSLYQVAKVLGVSASASVIPVNIQRLFPLGWTGLISLLSKGLWRCLVF